MSGEGRGCKGTDVLGRVVAVQARAPLTGDSRVFVVALLILARRGTHDDGAAAGAALGGEGGLVGGERLHDGIAGSERLHGERLLVGSGM